MKNRGIGPLKPDLLAVLFVCAAAALHLAIVKAVGGPIPTFVLFYPAIILSALIGGVRPGLLATILAALIATWLLIPPIGSLRIKELNETVGLALFCFSGIFISLIAGRLQASRIETESARRTEQLLRRYELLASHLREREEAARESEERFRAMIEHNMDAILVTDPSGAGRILSLNPAASTLLGWSAEELLAMRREDVLDATDPRLAAFLKTRKEALWGRIELTCRRKGGTTFTCEVTSSIFRGRDGEERAVTVIRDITPRKEMEEALRRSRDELEQRVQERTAELLESRERRRRLTAELINAQETERKRVAQEIHDSVIAGMAAVKLKLDRKLSIMKREETSESWISLEEIIENVAVSIRETRRIMENLHPAALDDLGLLAAINWFCREFEKAHAEIEVKKEAHLKEGEIPGDLKVVVYRVMQEAFNNIAKHSKATAVAVFLAGTGKVVELAIQDNGVGFDPENPACGGNGSRCLGLSGMRERVELSGGEFEIRSAPGKGTMIRASWPVSRI